MSQDQDIGNYIRQNRTTYTREAITNNLLAMGHQQEVIDRAWAQLEHEAVPTKPSDNLSGFLLGFIPLWIIGLLFGLVYLFLSANSSSILFFGARPPSGPVYPIFNILFIVTQIVGLVVAVLLSRRGWSPTRLVILLVTFNFVWFIVILGTCLSGGFRG